MIQVWWLSNQQMTVRVSVENGIIKDAAPIVRKFIGQHLSSLYRWMAKQRGLRMVNIGPHEQDAESNRS